jgi:PAS domain S-box-containing protein
LRILKQNELSETIINSLPGVFYIQSVTGEYLLWNKNFEIVSGYTKEEIVRLRTEDLIIEEDHERVIDTIKKLFVDGYATVEATVKTKNDTRIHFLLTGIPIMYQDQLCLLGTGIDISSRIKAEEELRSSEQKYKLLFESNPLSMWMVAKDDMSIIAVNEAAAHQYGYEKDELLHMNIDTLRPTEDLELQLNDFQKEINGLNDFGIARHIKKDGSIIFVRIISNDIVFDGKLVRLSLTNDVTEAVTADELLKKSEANLKTILDTTDTAYALLDKTLNVMAFNQMALKFVSTQYHRKPASGDKLSDFFPTDRFPEFKANIDEVLKGNSISYEINYPQADGSVYWYDVRLFPITNKKNEILGSMLALSDITERKGAEESLKTAYIRIQDHVNNIKDITWKQSHLIRSPLANLKGLAAMLKDDPSDNEILEFIQTELERLDQVIIEMAEDASREELY